MGKAEHWPSRHARRRIAALGVVAAVMGCGTPLAQEVVVTIDGEPVTELLALRVSRDGRVIAFSTPRDNNVSPCESCVSSAPIHIFDRAVGRLAPRCADIEPAGTLYGWDLSEDGRYIVFQDGHARDGLGRLDWRACTHEQIDLPSSTYAILPDGGGAAWSHAWQAGVMRFDGPETRFYIPAPATVMDPGGVYSMSSSRDGRRALIEYYGGAAIVDFETETLVELRDDGDLIEVTVSGHRLPGVFSYDGASTWTSRLVDATLYSFERTRVADVLLEAASDEPSLRPTIAGVLDDERVVVGCTADFGPDTLGQRCILRPNGTVRPIRGTHPSAPLRIQLDAVAATSHELVYASRQDTGGYRIYIIPLDG